MEKSVAYDHKQILIMVNNTLESYMNLVLKFDETIYNWRNYGDIGQCRFCKFFDIIYTPLEKDLMGCRSCPLNIYPLDIDIELNEFTPCAFGPGQHYDANIEDKCERTIPPKSINSYYKELMSSIRDYFRDMDAGNKNHFVEIMIIVYARLRLKFILKAFEQNGYDYVIREKLTRIKEIFPKYELSEDFNEKI